MPSANELRGHVEVVVPELGDRKDLLGNLQLAVRAVSLTGHNKNIEQSSPCVRDLAQLFHGVVDCVSKPIFVGCRVVYMRQHRNARQILCVLCSSLQDPLDDGHNLWNQHRLDIRPRSSRRLTPSGNEIAINGVVEVKEHGPLDAKPF